MMEPVRVMKLLTERKGKNKIIYDEYRNAIAWWDSYEKYEFPLFTVQENEPVINSCKGHNHYGIGNYSDTEN